MFILIKGETFLWIYSHYIYSLTLISDDTTVLNSGNLCFVLKIEFEMKVLLNHRGSKMNLRFLIDL